MKAICVRQPHAHRIITGEKMLENRNQPWSHVGLVAIHASQSRCDIPLGVRYAGMEFGAVIGVVEMLDCLLATDIHAGKHDLTFPWLLDQRQHAEGKYCYLFINPVRWTEPLPWSGRLGRWDLPDEVIRNAR